MAMQTQQPQRPYTKAPTDKPKAQMDVVFATSPDGAVYELPKDVAKRYEFTEERAKTLGDVPLAPTVVPAADEVGGRHRMWLRDGTYRFHNDWNYGPYIWHADYAVYTGYHWHPNADSPVAYDVDD
jgi:hypothetical protein